ncbi:MAG: folate-binding protein YgfZ [Candidatus Fonsibacter lacus]|jgi:folate-binding protein YgfZ|uniref:Folate-binding protein YgfZ n=1 Tax=Candidatus Fonsibacter lacus TaxID=2576439 RepID=A0A966HTU9_9PROT|nr:folate-binding protein YgfZ [Candidatus Fonsibacter lacus]
METDKAYITSKGFISINGEDSIEFIQNIISNDIKKVTDNNCIFASLLTPQGKLLFEFIIFKTKNIFLIECNNELINELFNKLYNYKLRSKVEIKIENNLISVDIPFEKFISLNVNKLNLINYKNYIIFEDPRIKKTLARAIIEQSKIKDFLNDLNIELSNEKNLLEKKLFNLGIPSKNIQKLQNQLFALEANFLELNGIDQKKGCYIGQENTARMHLKNKVNKRLFALQMINGKVKEGQKITLNNEEIGKILIDDLFPFALIKINNENKNLIIDKELKTETASIKINIPNWMIL